MEKLDLKFSVSSFNNEELSLIKRRFNSLLYFPYLRVSSYKSTLSYILPCVPFFMEGDGWKFICSDIKMHIEKAEIGGVIEYTFDMYLSGVKYVDGKSCDTYIKSSYSSNVNLSELVDELLSVISEYKLFEEEHRVEHISI